MVLKMDELRSISYLCFGILSLYSETFLFAYLGSLRGAGVLRWRRIKETEGNVAQRRRCMQATSYLSFRKLHPANLSLFSCFEIMPI